MASGKVSAFSASRFDSGCMFLPVSVVVGTVSVHSAMLVLSGTCCASVYGMPVARFFIVNWWIMDPQVVSRPALFLRCAWFDSGYMFMRQSTWLVFLVTTNLALYSFVVLRSHGRHHGQYGHEGQSTTGAAVPQLQFLRSLTPLSLHSG